MRLVNRVIAGLALAQVMAAPLAAQSAPSPAQTTPLTLPQAVRIAVERSPEIGQAEQRALGAEAARDAAGRQWRPKLSIEGVAGMRHLENDRRIALGLSARDEKPLYASVALDQPLFDMGRRTRDRRSQAARAEAAWASFDTAGEATAYNVARAYLEMLLNQQLIVAAQDNLAFHEQIAGDMREGVSRGAMSIAERQQAEERRQQARVTLAETRDDLEAARNQFAALVGTLGAELSMPEEPGPAVMPATVDEAVALIAANSARVREAEKMLDSATEARRRAEADFGPTIDLRGTARTGSDFDGYGGKTRDYSAMAMLRWNVWDGGVTAARVREAGHREQEARLGLVEERRDAEKNARNTWAKLTTWKIKSAELGERAQIADDLLVSYKAQFDIGRRSLLDLLDSQSARHNARTQAEVARFGTLLAEFEILALGNRLRQHFGARTTRGDEVVGPYGPQL